MSVPAPVPGPFGRCCAAGALLPWSGVVGLGPAAMDRPDCAARYPRQSAGDGADLDSSTPHCLNHCHCGEWIARSCTVGAVSRDSWAVCPAFQNPGGPAQLDPCPNTKRTGLSIPKPSILAPWIWQLTLCNRNLRPFICRGRPEQAATCSTRGPWMPRTGQTSVRPRPMVSPPRTTQRRYTLPGGEVWPVHGVCTPSGGRSRQRPQHPSKRSASSGGARPPC